MGPKNVSQLTLADHMRAADAMRALLEEHANVPTKIELHSSKVHASVSASVSASVRNSH
jgi:hypothetical protein